MAIPVRWITLLLLLLGARDPVLAQSHAPPALAQFGPLLTLAFFVILYFVLRRLRPGAANARLTIGIFLSILGALVTITFGNLLLGAPDVAYLRLGTGAGAFVLLTGGLVTLYAWRARTSRAPAADNAEPQTEPCLFCGKPTKVEARFCRFCGRELLR